MSFNTLGSLFAVTTFGESHGVGVGAVIDGCPAGIIPDMPWIQNQLNRRRPGYGVGSSPRAEDDKLQFLSGLFEGKTTGAPITVWIENKNVKSGDYERIKEFYRPSHADFVYDKKYGHSDYTGGGRSSARTTAPVVAAGALAQQLLQSHGIFFRAYVHAVGPLAMDYRPTWEQLNHVDQSPVRCPDATIASAMETLIQETRAKGDSVGGVIRLVIQGVPAGLGDPMFQKLHAGLGHAFFSINAVKGVSFGDGFEASKSFGSLQNDAFEKMGETWRTTSNHSGGIQGGISNGMDILADIAFKPVSTIMQDQTTATRAGEQSVLHAEGRHDACVVPRAIPIVEAYAAIIVYNHLLIQKGYTSI